MKKIVVMIFVWCTTVTLYAHTEIKIEKLSQHDYHEAIDIYANSYSKLDTILTTFLMEKKRLLEMDCLELRY